MRIARFTTGNDPRYALVEGEPGSEELVVISGDPIYTPVQPTGERLRLDQDGVRLLAPVIPRSKIIGVGRNYADHAAEHGHEVPAQPLLFLKPNTSVIGPDDPIVLPDWTEHVEHEAELAVVIGKVTKDVRPDKALDQVFGFTVANDVTARDIQRSDLQWTRAKGFDTSCPIGPWIVPGLDVDDLAVRARVNGVTTQDGRTSQMVFDVAYLISYVSEVFTLLPGDVILTGTPAGVSPIVARDVVEVEVEDIGTLRNPVLRRS
ncbi:fumarylacetoacetate hydrolase family protein [Cellulomonas soli]|uniref:2-hydroxyhepta-2,4-diene-1,7-dioate isomerase n=1 Tax=Cellulomonas soli TaxID=931535 RepID=A0A512PDX8_9CELL|nr:fumarylacetoacetate hydrolase family protein [Cellulomonas soli]NYI60005.1 2-keto-4-pentenoate hydratase/2-oxohepta-3-ene-1,7-dioic acid hydratase in catechol pathway [Cellulomonas soli]GEP69342.1 2-hydroxyhepta-2,4-diene-1,7-dioate isomerase [Cellulomonas soli]